jgi:hypothetical protein
MTEILKLSEMHNGEIEWLGKMDFISTGIK